MVSELMTPAHIHRKLVRDTLTASERYTPSPDAPDEDDVAFRAFLEKRYRDNQAALAGVTDTSAMKGRRADCYLCAVGLLTYGRLDMVSFILDAAFMKDDRMQVLSDLLPLPDDISRFYWTHQVRDWFAAHRARLVWDADAGCFLLKEAAS